MVFPWLLLPDLNRQLHQFRSEIFRRYLNSKGSGSKESLDPYIPLPAEVSDDVRPRFADALARMDIHQPFLRAEFQKLLA